MKNNRPIEVGQVRMVQPKLYPFQTCSWEITMYVILSYNSKWVQVQYLQGEYKSKTDCVPIGMVMQEVVVM